MEQGVQALHITAMVTWMAGMIAVPPLLVGADSGRATALRALFGRLATPAMLLTLALGLWLAVDGGWFRSGWLHAKLTLVVALTALHGIVSGRARRAAGGVPVPGWFAWMPALVIGAVATIAFLVVTKPTLW